MITNLVFTAFGLAAVKHEYTKQQKKINQLNYPQNNKNGQTKLTTMLKFKCMQLDLIQMH